MSCGLKEQIVKTNPLQPEELVSVMLDQKFLLLTEYNDDFLEYKYDLNESTIYAQLELSELGYEFVGEMIVLSFYYQGSTEKIRLEITPQRLGFNSVTTFKGRDLSFTYIKDGISNFSIDGRLSSLEDL